MMDMDFQIERDICPSYEIAAYIDGELDTAHEIELDMHFASCSICTDELNHQKHFLCTLNSSLRNEHEIDLPKDFTKQIVANAESHVVGLRGSRERFNAIFIIAALLLFVLFALGADAGSLFSAVKTFAEQVTAVGMFLGRLIYSFFVGIIIILRTFAAPFQGGLIVGALFVCIFAFASAFAPRFFVKLRRY
jgi:anti-sigma factor RsiW